MSNTPTIPLQKVTLYKHGIGYFERQGKINGPGTVELQCGPDEIDDMLKSLLVLSPDGGKTFSVTYESSKPLEERLAEFGFNLRGSQNIADLLGQLKGTPVRVIIGGKTHSGRVVGLDTAQKAIAQAICVERFLLILTSDNMLLRLDIAAIEGITLEDEALASELQQQLELLFLSVKKKDRKLLKIDIADGGEQDLFVAYSIACPIWKTSYRLVFDKDERLMLQGVAIVDNVQEEDWSSVEMVLVSSSPVSFIQPLYEPIKPSRRTIEGQGVQSSGPFVAERARKMKAAPGAGGRDLYFDEPMQTSAQSVMAMAPAQPGAPAPVNAPVSTGAFRRFDMAGAMSEPANIETAERGENFEYHINGRVSIPRNSSALIPVVQQFVEGERISLYQETRNAEFPYATVKLRNNTGLTLEAGPVTVMEDESYAGEALLDVVKPDDSRFLPYALDQSVQVVVRNDFKQKPFWRVQVHDALLYFYHKELTQKTYSIENMANKKKIVYVEHPARDEWKLVAPGEANGDKNSAAFEKPEETTKSFYRFRIELEGKSDHELVVTEEKVVTTQYYLLTEASPGDAYVQALFNQNYSNKKFLEFLKQVQAIRGELFDLNGQLRSLGDLVVQHESEQKRARENVKTLGAGAERFRQAIEESEDKIIATQKQMQIVKEKINAKQEQLRQALTVRIEADVLETSA